MEWISIEDRLPTWGHYIVCLKNNAVMEMSFSDIVGNNWCCIGIGNENKDNPVTHWMPLPEPPTK